MQGQEILINIEETAKLLRVQPNTIRVWLSRRKVLPNELIVRLGRRVLFKADLLYKWIDEGCKFNFEPCNEKSSEAK